MKRAAVSASTRRSALSSRRVTSSSSPARCSNSLRLTPSNIGPQAEGATGATYAVIAAAAQQGMLRRRKAPGLEPAAHA